MKELYRLLITALKTISDIKWIDLESGQLDSTRPALKYPCVLVKISSVNNDIDESGSQEKNWTVQLRTAFDATNSRTSGDTPENIQDRSLAYIDTSSDIYELFQGNELGNFYAFECIQEGQEDRSDGLVVFKHVFKTGEIVFK